MRTAPPLEIPVDFAGTRPGAKAIVAALRLAIDQGKVRPGQRLPSTRLWAEQLGVSRGTLVGAFEQLTGEGYLVSRVGSGTVVNPRLGETHRRPVPIARVPGVVPGRPGADVVDLTVDRPPADALSGARWRSAWRRAADGRALTVPPAGLPALRAALSEHLVRMRDVVRSPEEIFVTAGAREGLALLRTALWPEGRRVRVGVEQPGYPTMRRALSCLGCETVPVPLDAGGMRTDLLRHPSGAGIGRGTPVGGLEAILVTPSHQYPFGGSLRRGRRSELIAWGRAAGGIVLEDDYDSELRYAGRPLPALCALDDPVDGSVATLGTFSKTLAADVGVGYLIVPRRLAPRLTAVREALGLPVPAIAQEALAAYLRSGELERHTARLRRLYRARRDEALAGLEGLPGVAVLPMDGGLHIVVEVARSEPALLAECARRGVRVTGLASYWSGPAQRRGVVIGCALPDSARFSEGLRRLRAALLADKRPVSGTHDAYVEAADDEGVQYERDTDLGEDQPGVALELHQGQQVHEEQDGHDSKHESGSVAPQLTPGGPVDVDGQYHDVQHNQPADVKQRGDHHLVDDQRSQQHRGDKKNDELPREHAPISDRQMSGHALHRS